MTMMMMLHEETCVMKEKAVGDGERVNRSTGDT